MKTDATPGAGFGAPPRLPRRAGLALLLLAAAFFGFARAPELHAAEWSVTDQQLEQTGGTVAHCFDGDTLKLRDRRVVRLAGIDAPELGCGQTQPQYYAREARTELERLTKGKQVSLHAAGVNDHDRHGRLVAELRLADGRSLNELMVASGAAFFYPHRDLGPEFQERLRALQAQAIHERRGFWAHLLSLPLARETYVGNRASLRFFPVNCPEARNIKPRNRIHFGTLMDAFLAGYAPARICLFWPSAR